VERFDGKHWSSRSPLPSPRYIPAACVFKETILVIGGTNVVSKILADVLQYDGFRWTNGPPLPSPRVGLSLTVAFGSVYVIGGCSVYWLALKTVFVYDGNSSRSAPPLQTARFGHASVLFKGSIYVVGGTLSKDTSTHVSEYTGKIERFDGKAWSYFIELGISRFGRELIVMPNVLYAIENGAGTDNDIDVFDDKGLLSNIPFQSDVFGFAAVLY